MKPKNFDLQSENVLTINEMVNVRGGDGDEGVTQTTNNREKDIIL